MQNFGVALKGNVEDKKRHPVATATMAYLSRLVVKKY
jgi:hypothetical protein